MKDEELWMLWADDDAADTYDDEKELDALEIENYLKQIIKQDP